MHPSTSRHQDGSADYGVIGERYNQFRRPDLRIANLIADALGNAQTVLNVGAGAGSYEPIGRTVSAVEPSASMRAQRPSHLPAAIDAVAESFLSLMLRSMQACRPSPCINGAISMRACANCVA